MRQSFSRFRGTSIALVAGLALLLLLVFYAYRSASKRQGFQPYPTGHTSFSYAGTRRQEFDGQEFAVFKFRNGESFQLKVRAKVLAWDEGSMAWKEDAIKISETVPHRSQWEIHIGREGKWKVMAQAYAQPTLPQKLTDRFAGGRARGGLLGAWSSPEMNDSKPAKRNLD